MGSLEPLETEVTFEAAPGLSATLEFMDDIPMEDALGILTIRLQNRAETRYDGGQPAYQL